MHFSAVLAGALALCQGFITASPVVSVSNSHTPEVSHQLVARNTTSVGGVGAPEEPFWKNKESFWGSCDQCRLTGQGAKLGLRCRCLRDNDKDIRFTTLDLNNCIGSNKNGELTWEKDGWFTKSCTEINGRFYKGDLMSGPARPAIHAKCQSAKPYYDTILGRSTLELYERIHNHDGNLWCEPDIETAVEGEKKKKEDDHYWSKLHGMPGRNGGGHR